MPLISLDTTGSIDSSFGISQDQLLSTAPMMDQLRDDFLVQVECGENHFFDLPMQQYQAYQQQREASPLGRIFDVGTGLHDHVDAVVVVGSIEATAAARGIFRSCCDPYHNELSRAERGCRPRMYFAGNTFDNDDLAALINRLNQRDFRDSPAETRWAMLVMDLGNEESHQVSDETRLAFQALLQQMSDPQKFLFSVVIEDSWLDQQTRKLDCENMFGLLGGYSSIEQTLSALSLLPSAMLGLDCIKLLEGAVMMNEHFKSAPTHKNVVLQFVAVQHLLARHHGIIRRSMRPWPSGLDWLPAWYQSICEADCVSASDRSLVVNWIAEKPRYDPIELADHMTAAMNVANQADHISGKPTLTIRLPTIDTRVLGQIFQMLMIATKIEAGFRDSPAFPSSD